MITLPRIASGSVVVKMFQPPSSMGRLFGHPSVSGEPDIALGLGSADQFLKTQFLNDRPMM